jgi:hypothetical protein
VHRWAGSEESIFFPNAAGAASGNAAKDIVVVLFESSVVTDDTSVNEGGELTVKDLPVSDLAALLVRIGYTTTSFEATQFNSHDSNRKRNVAFLFIFPKNFHTLSSSNHSFTHISSRPEAKLLTNYHLKHAMFLSLIPTFILRDNVPIIPARQQKNRIRVK